MDFQNLLLHYGWVRSIEPHHPKTDCLDVVTHPECKSSHSSWQKKYFSTDYSLGLVTPPTYGAP